MHRTIVYDGELPATLDILNSGKSALQGIAFHNAAMFGLSTVMSSSYAVAGPVVQGLQCTPTVPTTDMNVNIAPGQIFALDAMDAVAYGDLGTDANVVYKQGILYIAQKLLVSPPALTSGQSVNILVEIQLQDLDDVSTVLPYYNPANPALPVWGPTGAATQALGTAQNTVRLNPCKVQLKNGTAATTGSQTTPAVDSGYTGLYVITVPFGFSTIISTYITSYQVTGKAANGVEQSLSLPYFPNLPTVPPDHQTSAWTYSPDTGTLNVMAATCYPLVTSLVAGQMAYVKAAFTNTSTVTFNLNGTGAKAVHRATGTALSAGDITAGELCWFIYDGTSWQVVNFYATLLAAQTNFYNTFAVSYGVDYGTVNNILVTPKPPITALTAGLVLAVKVANANTDGTTITLFGLPTVPLLENQLPLKPSAIVPNEIIIVEYDGANFQKQPKRWPYSTFDVSAPPPPVFLAVGDQLNITFTNTTSIPLNVSCVQGIYEVEFFITANNSTNLDTYFLPNDSPISASSSSNQISGIVNSDSGVSSSPYVGSLAISQHETGFFFEMFDGPNRSDTLNDIGAFILKFTINTNSSAKSIRYIGGARGGSTQGFAKWNSDTTPWTSLGTYRVNTTGNSVYNPSDTFANLSGAAIVKRLA